VAEHGGEPWRLAHEPGHALKLRLQRRRVNVTPVITMRVTKALILNRFFG
jgi:hypothetical protein